jgi:hypothetical protein
MSQTIRVTPSTRFIYDSLDPSLQDELRGHAAAIAASPSETLRRTTPPLEPAGLWAYSYTSRVAPGLNVVLYIDGLADDPPELVLVDIAHSMSDPEPEDVE